MISQETLAIGSADTGLCGPFLFPFRWTFERKRGHRSARRSAHRLMPAHTGKPLFVEAGHVPVKALRHLLQCLALRVAEHRHIDIGETFFEVFPSYCGNDEESLVDFLADGASITRAGSRSLVLRLGQWFQGAWAKLQARAIASGNYFPPPRILRARVSRSGGVRIEAGFAPGFLPFDHLLAAWLPPGDRRLGTLWLLDADEPIPLGETRKTFLQRCAERLARPGERVVSLGTLWGDAFDAAVAARVRVGDPLTLIDTGDDRFGRWAFYWQGKLLGGSFLDSAIIRRILDGTGLEARVSPAWRADAAGSWAHRLRRL